MTTVTLNSTPRLVRSRKAATPRLSRVKTPPVQDVLERRNQIILDHLPLVKYVAGRIASRLPSHVEVDDLVNAGIIGLIDAIDKFDDERQIKFKTYAEFRIKGAILDELRALDWMPRTTRQKATRLERAYSELEQLNGRPATEDEVASYLEISHEELQSLLMEARGICLISMEDLYSEGEESADRNLLECLADPDALKPSDLVNLDQVYAIVAESIEQLPEKERLVVSLYYQDELTMKEIGEILEVTESRVSQIHTKAILRLRGRLAKVLEA